MSTLLGFAWLIFIIFLIWMAWWGNTPEGKAYNAKVASENAERIARARSEREANKEFYSFTKILETLKQEPDNIDYYNSIPSCRGEGDNLEFSAK